MGFERRLGLGIAESEQFHSILRGKKEITEDLAKQINNLFLLRIFHRSEELIESNIVELTDFGYRFHRRKFLPAFIFPYFQPSIIR